MKERRKEREKKSKRKDNAEALRTLRFKEGRGTQDRGTHSVPGAPGIQVVSFQL